MPVVELDYAGTVEFPDDMPAEEIQAAAKRLDDEAAAAEVQRRADINVPARSSEELAIKRDAAQKGIREVFPEYAGEGKAQTFGEMVGTPLLKLPTITKQVAQDALDMIGTFPSEDDTRTPQERFDEQAAASRTPGRAAQVLAGAVNAGKKVPEAMTSPLGIAAMATGGAPLWLQRVVALGFTADMLHASPQQWQRVGQVWDNGSLDEKTEALGDALVNSAFVVGAGKHAATPAKVQMARQVAKMIAEADPAGAGEQGGGSVANKERIGLLPPREGAQHITFPESFETMRAQFDLLEQGKRKAVLVTDGEEVPPVPEGMMTENTPAGMFIYDPNWVKPEELHAAVKEDRVGDALGYGIPRKPAPGEEVGVVVVRDAAGTEVQAVVTDHAHMDAVKEAAEGVKPEGGTVTVEAAEKVIAERKAKLTPQEWEEELKPDVRRDLKAEGVTPENIEALLKGEKTAAQVVDEQLGFTRGQGSSDAKTMIVEEHGDGSRSIGFTPEAGPGAMEPRNIGQMSHEEAIAAAREQGVERIQRVLSVAHGIDAEAQRRKPAKLKRNKAKAETPVVAEQKMQKQVEHVADTSGPRPAKEVKSELVQRIEAAMEKAPSERELEAKARQALELSRKAAPVINIDNIDFARERAVRDAAVEKEGLKKVTIHIPGDGTFTIWNTKEALAEVLEKARKLDVRDRTKTGAPVDATERAQRTRRLAPIGVPEEVTPETLKGARAQVAEFEEAVKGLPDDRELPNPGRIMNKRSSVPKSTENLLTALHTRERGATVGGARKFLSDRLRQLEMLVDEPSERTAPAEAGTPSGETVATVEQATLPRRIEAPDIEGTEPVSLASIREYLSEALDIPVRMGTRVQKGLRRALGLFRIKPETIRMKALNDIPTLAHEVGHYLHFILFPRGGTLSAGNLRASNFAKAFDGELMALGRRTSLPSYKEHQVRMEGVAEFVREWMTDRSKALAKAPGFTAFFESELQGKYPEVWKIVEQARTDLGRYINQPAQMKVRSMISRTGEDMSLPIGERLEKFYTNWVNSLRPIGRAMETLERFGVPPGMAKMVTDFAVNHIGGWRGKVEYTLWKKQIDLAGNEVGPGLRQVLAGVESLDDFRDYLVARRALEKNSQGMKTGIESADARDVVTALGAKYESKRLELLEFQRQQLTVLVQAGVLSPKSFAKMVDLNQDYVPFFRVYDAVSGGKGGAGSGFVNLAQGVHRFKGSDRQIVDPLESIVKNAYVYRELAERNVVGQLFIQAVESTRGGGRVAESIAKRMKGTQVTHEEVVRTLKAAGIDTDALGVDDMDLAFKVWRAARQPSAKDGIFTVWRGGKEEVYQLGDQELHRALTMADAESMKISNGLIRAMFVWPTQALRAGATLTLEFMARNPFRDQVTAGVFSKHGFVPFFDGFRGMLSAIGKDQLYHDWVKAGGRYSDFVALDRTDLQKTLADVVKEPGALRMALDLADPRNVLQNLRKFSEIMEQATRISEFRRARADGLSDLEAANASKDVTLNFARSGRTGKAVNQLVAFFNASIQDVDKIVRAHKERPFQTTAKAIMYITVPSVLTWYLGKDDPEMQKLPDWRRNFFWNVNLRKLGALAGHEGGDTILSFPKPFLLGQLYGSSVERALDYATARDPNAVKKWLAGVQTQSPVSVENLLPTATRPLVETLANYSFFRKQPVENFSQQQLPADLRFNPNTSIVARKLSKLTPWDMSPVKWDNAIRGYLGGLGRYGTEAADWVMIKSEVADVPAAPAKDLGERPLLKAFVKSPYEASIYVGRFYDAAEAAEQRVAALKKAPELMSTDEQQQFLQGAGEDLAFYLAKVGGHRKIQDLRDWRDKMGQVNKTMVTVQANREFTPEEKRDKLKALARMRDDLAEAGFKALVSPGDQRKWF